MMRQRESKQPRKKEPAKEEHSSTEQEPNTSTKIAEGSVHEHPDQMVAGDHHDPVVKDIANTLQGKQIMLDYQQWCSFLQSMRDCSNHQKDSRLSRILNDITTGAPAFPTHTKLGVLESKFLLNCLMYCHTTYPKYFRKIQCDAAVPL